MPGRALFRHLFIPGLIAFSLLPWLAHARSGEWGWSATSRAGSTALVLALTMLGIWMAEQVFPRHPEWNAQLFADAGRGVRRLGRDCLYLFGVTQVTALLLAAVGPALETVRFAHLWPTAAPFAARVLLAFFAIELCSYWVHRAAHRSRLLWQFHSTHHFATELNGLKSVRTHPIDNLVFHVGRTVPLLLVGAGPDELVAATYFGGVLGILAHANLDVSDRVLGLVFNFPQVHAVHHSADLDESRCNFGCHTVLWDRVFRTYRGSARAQVIGVAPVGPHSAWQELAWPFFRWVSRWASPSS